MSSIKLSVPTSQVQPAIIICNNASYYILIHEIHLEYIECNNLSNVYTLKIRLFAANREKNPLLFHLFWRVKPMIYSFCTSVSFLNV